MVILLIQHIFRVVLLVRNVTLIFEVIQILQVKGILVVYIVVGQETSIKSRKICDLICNIYIDGSNTGGIQIGQIEGDTIYCGGNQGRILSENTGRIRS